MTTTELPTTGGAAEATTGGTRRTPSTVKVERVTRWYGDVIALNDVTLEVGPGVSGLLGPNGAGKTTLIRLITGMASPGDGQVLLDGEPIRNRLSALERIGYVADGDALYDELTARRFLVDQAATRGFTGKARDERATQVLERVGLTEAADRRVGGFSKGMRQRVKLAQALIHDPDVLVLDEPLTGLDPVMRRDVIRVARELGEEGVSVLVSSHVLHEVEAMTDRVILMHHGRVLAEGSVEHIRDRLDTYARRIRVETTDPRGLGRHLLGVDGLVTGLALEDDALVVETMHPDRTCAELQDAAAEGKFPISLLDPLDEDLQSVFRYLVD